MKIKPKDLGCFEQVANVIGKKQAKIELQKVLDMEGHCSDEGFYNIVSGKELRSAFYWKHSPQGRVFWDSIDDGYVPEELRTKTFDEIVKEGYSKSTSPSLKFIYINYKGDVGVREVINPIMVYLVDDKYHGTGWCMKAFDVDKGKERVYSVKNVVKWL